MHSKKTQTVEELWHTTYIWLNSSGFKINKSFCKEEITNHPDYPAITSITDFLDEGGMQYNAVKSDASFIHEFNYPVLAHIKASGQEYLHIIPNAEEWDKQRNITKYWSGVVLFPEKNTHWTNDQNDIYKRTMVKNNAISFLLILLASCLLIYSSLNVTNYYAILYGLLSLVGLLIAMTLLGTELGYEGNLTKKVCGAVSQGGCEKVLKSEQGKGWMGITPADISLLYFGAQFILYLFSAYFGQALLTILVISFATVPIAGWSLYTQAFKLKQWCALCLGVVGVILLQVTIAIFTLPSLYTIFPSNGIIFFSTSFFVLALGLVPIKALIKTNKSNKQQLGELKKWKTDASLFLTQWQQEQEADSSIWQNDLLLGNINAPIKITVACNPYCAPCASAHEILDKMLQKYKDRLAVQVRFLCDAEDENDKRTIAIVGILQKATAINSNEELQYMLADWFKWMDYEKWISKWIPNNSVDVKSDVLQHQNWIASNKIAFTPTLFVNGRKLPRNYGLNDLDLLIPQLSEIARESLVK